MVTLHSEWLSIVNVPWQKKKVIVRDAFAVEWHRQKFSKAVTVTVLTCHYK